MIHFIYISPHSSPNVYDFPLHPYSNSCLLHFFLNNPWSPIRAAHYVYGPLTADQTPEENQLFLPTGLWSPTASQFGHFELLPSCAGIWGGLSYAGLVTVTTAAGHFWQLQPQYSSERMLAAALSGFRFLDSLHPIFCNVPWAFSSECSSPLSALRPVLRLCEPLSAAGGSIYDEGWELR